eukprot:5232132-Pyramimonas_sp.AAC.1
MDMTVRQHAAVVVGARHRLVLPYSNNIRALSMWLAPYKDGGYHWEYIFDARTGLGSGHFSFLDWSSGSGSARIDKGSSWRDTIYINGVAATTSNLVASVNSATTTYAPWIH